MDEKFVEFCQTVKARLKNDWDIVIAVTGEEGVGKTALSIQLAQMIDDGFHMDGNVAYLPDYEDIKRKFNLLPQYAVFLIDEAAKVLYKLRWMNTLQQGINEMYMTERKQNKCTFLLIPRFIDLNEHFRNHRVKIWIHILERGKAVAFLRDDDKDVEDPWHIKDNYKLKEKYFRWLPIYKRTFKDKSEAEKRTMNYFFEFEFEDLSIEVWAEYKKYYQFYKEQEQIEKPLTTWEERYKMFRKASGMMLIWLKNDGWKELQQAEIAEGLGISMRTITRLLDDYKTHAVYLNQFILNSIEERRKLKLGKKTLIMEHSAQSLSGENESMGKPKTEKE